MRRAVVTASIALVTSCGRLHFDPIDRDAGAGADAGSDATMATCWGVWESGTVTTTTPVAVTTLNTTFPDKNPFLTQDGLTMYFSSSRTGSEGGYDVWKATRPTLVDDSFGMASEVPDVSSNKDEGRFEMSADGLSGVLSADLGANLYDLYLATRGDTSSTFTLQLLPAPISTASDDKDPHLSVDGHTLYFSQGQLTLLAAPYDGSSVGTPTVLPGFENMPGVGDPNPSPDELAIVFSYNGSGGVDLGLAIRASLSDPFGPPIPLPSLSSASTDQDVFLTPDGCDVWLASDRAGNFDIYVAHVIH
jgi:hypothetical protein